MNVLILGKNEINRAVAENLAEEGIEAVIMEDASEIVKFKGEPGAFTVTARTGEFSFASVIITEPPGFEALAAGGEKTLNLADDGETERLPDLRTREKIVILLDYAEETPEYMTARGIGLAKRLSEKKKDVTFLSKTVKSGFGGSEIRYLEARNSGAAFVKYEKASLSYDEERGKFIIEAGDGVFDLSIATPYVISVKSGETPELEIISKKLRLYKKNKKDKNQNGGLNDDKFFLYPAFSTRRGVYYVNPALISPDMEQSVRQAVFAITADMAAIKAPGYVKEINRGFNFPEVDPDKCAFCYSCYRACVHGALEPDIGLSAMKVMESECEACCTCIAICPGEAIARKDSRRQPAGKGKYKIYCCENGAAYGFESLRPFLGEYGRIMDSERVACGGSVGADMLANDFKDYETVIVACCVEDACRHMDGEKRACRQVRRAAELLQKAGLAKKRVEIINVSHEMKNLMKDKILNILGESV